MRRFCFSLKKRFLLELYRSGLKRETILAIYKFIDWVMQLSEELETELHEEMKSTEETTQMPHITTAERIGIKKGIEQGIEQSLNSVHRVIATLIKMKFGENGLPLTARAQKVQRLELLEKVAEQLMFAQTASEAEKIFNEIEVSNSH